MIRDNGFSHLDDIERDDLQATQKLAQKRTESVGNNRVAEGGIIESIQIVNFMCHENLTVNLGPLINFVVGENGSGKSAVLTALTLCLGGKASDTNRGGSLRSFVREGQDRGFLAVKIKNGGTDAYQHDIYGDTITIERHFSKTGSSGFKIKSDAGRIISTKKQEVDEISEWYALQISNPLTVLSQDNARQFLNSASPAQKYNFFVSGVQLEQLDNDYKMSQDTLDKTLILRDDLNERIAQVEKDMKDAQRLSETAQKNQTLREKSRLYRHQLAWSQVVEQERELEKCEQVLVMRDQRITEGQENCEQWTAELLACDQRVEQSTYARQCLIDEQGGLDERVATAEGEHNKVKKALTELQREERDAYARLKTATEDIKKVEQQIEEEEQKLGESTGPERAQKDSELADATAREKDLNEQHIETREQTLPSVTAKSLEVEKHVNELEKAKQQKRNEIVTATKHVHDLEDSTGQPLDGFDREMRELINAVENDQSFIHKPIGPLGAHINLLKPEWSAILEKTFGETLNAFVVRNKQDQSRLANLMQRSKLRRHPPIYIAYGGHIDTAAQEPDEQFDTVLRVLQFDDDVVRSQLIINNSIEKIILVKERVEAERIMVDGNRPPKNVLACLTFHDGRRGHGLRITNRGGTTSTSPITPLPQRPRMRTDSGQQLALQRDHLMHLGTDMRGIEQELRQAKQALQRSQTEVKDCQKRLKELEDEIRRAQAEIERIQTDLDGFEGVDDRLVSLRSNLETKKEEAEGIGSQYGMMSLHKKDLADKAKDAKRRLEEEQGNRDDYQSRINKADSKLKSVIDLRRITLMKKNTAFEQLDSSRHERHRDQAKRDEQATRVEDWTNQAREMAPERVYIPEGETYQSIEQKYLKLKEQLQQREKRLGASDEEIHNRAVEAKKKYDDVTRQTSDIDDIIASLKRAIENRLHLWRQFQRQISARVRIQFTYLLSERGFRGKIDLDHRQRKVLIHVEPDETRKSAAGRSTKTLSGGEKSFSSICMLLSVWEAIGSPIRCLDEFDVFMDNVNRAISTNMLVSLSGSAV